MAGVQLAQQNLDRTLQQKCVNPVHITVIHVVHQKIIVMLVVVKPIIGEMRVLNYALVVVRVVQQHVMTQQDVLHAIQAGRNSQDKLIVLCVQQAAILVHHLEVARLVKLVTIKTALVRAICALLGVLVSITPPI